MVSHAFELLTPVFEGLLWLEPTNWLPGPSSPKPDKATAEYYAEHFNGEILNAQTHPKSIEQINEMVAALGMDYKPLVVVTEKFPLAPKNFQHMPNLAAFNGQGVIVANKSALRISGSTEDNLSLGIKSVIAHELSHLKYDSEAGARLLRGTIPILLPVAAIGGLYYYDKAMKHKNTVDDIANAQQDINQMADNHLQTLSQQQGAIRLEPKAYTPLINASRYIAVGMAAMAGALILNRHISLAKEFRADRVAVDLVKAPEEFIQFFTDIEQEWKNLAAQAHKNPELRNKLIPKTFAEKLERYQTSIHDQYLGAHPESKKRNAAIRSYAEKIGLGSAAEKIITR